MHGIYLIYRLHPNAEGQTEQRLVAKFVVAGGSLKHLEDHDGILEDTFPEGPVKDWMLYRLHQMENSPYWRVVNEKDIEQGEHPDLLPEYQDGQDWPAPQE